MPKITITNTATEEKWTLQGRLVWPWVNELRANWAKAQRAAEGRTRIVDLDEVRFIDEVPKTSVGKFDKKVLRANAVPIKESAATGVRR